MDRNLVKKTLNKILHVALEKCLIKLKLIITLINEQKRACFERKIDQNSLLIYFIEANFIKKFDHFYDSYSMKAPDCCKS